jgi:hypothetical protein
MGDAGKLGGRGKSKGLIGCGSSRSEVARELEVSATIDL